MISTPRVLLAGLLALFGLARMAPAQAQTDLTTPTSWLHEDDGSPQNIQNIIDLGYRMVDIEVLSASPPRFAGSFVRNTGDYGKGWWWYYDQTSAQVSSLLTQNNARLIDVEPYSTPNGLRYAVVLIPNTGEDFAQAHGWVQNFSASQLISWVSIHPSRRLIDVQPYSSGGLDLYAAIWVQNTGSQQSPWWFALNATQFEVDSIQLQNQARLIDFERHSSGLISAVMVPGDGKSWYSYVSLGPTQVRSVAEQFASRVIDIERYFTAFGPRYSVLLLQNDNDLAVDTNLEMRAHLPFSSSSGFLLRELGASINDHAGVLEGEPFEPASMLKTAHFYTALHYVSLGFDSLSANMTEYSSLDGSCPTGADPVTRSLEQVLRSMMEVSSNTATEAIRERYSTAVIENVCASVGATGVQLNHTVGCLCGNPRNQASLRDFAKLYGAVVNGELGQFEEEFYDLMLNWTNFGGGSYDTSQSLASAVAVSGLSSAEQAQFLDGVLVAAKGGSYGCHAPGVPDEEHRSTGAYVRLPFREGCEIVHREYFIGAWVNDVTSAASANNAMGAGADTLFRSILVEAIESWENADCMPFINYCSANPNSTGALGLSTWSGSSSLAANDLVLRATSLPLQSFGYLLVSAEFGFTPNPGGSAGNLCLSGGIGRYSAFVQSTGSSGTLELVFDQDAVPTAAGGVYSVSAGDTRYFQWWHRDSDGMGGATSNYTNGLAVTFL